ncbi:MAG: TetR/AcrR family transcriptional regulator [Burkholderiaceae bacterium]
MDVLAPSSLKKVRVSTLLTREKIISAATYEFAEKGYDGARMDEIALRAGIQKNVLYYYFKSKDGLYTEVLISTYELIRFSQAESKINFDDPVEGMRKLVYSIGKIWFEHPEFLRLLQSENILRGRHIKASRKIPDLYSPLMDSIKKLLRNGVDKKVFRSEVDPVDLYISITSLSAHYVSHQHTFEGIFKSKLMTSPRIRKRLTHCAEMVVRYLLVSNDSLNKGAKHVSSK